MTSKNRQDYLRLTARDFGPILDADIEMRPLTVFVGPSNTGKSYLAILVYALHKFFYRYASDDPFERIMAGPRQWDVELSTLDAGNMERLGLSEEVIAQVFRWTKDVVTETNASLDKFLDPFGSPDTELSELPTFISDVVRRLLNSDVFSDLFSTEITRCFGIKGVTDLLRYESGNVVDIEVQRAEEEIKRWTYNFRLSDERTTLSSEIPVSTPLQIGQTFQAIWHLSGDIALLRRADLEGIAEDERQQIVQYIGKRSLAYLCSEVSSHLFAPLNSPAYYLPAGRAGVMHAHQVVIRALIASASRTALGSDLPLPALSGVLGDFLEQLVDLAGGPSVRRRLTPRVQMNARTNVIAEDLERKILGGQLRKEETQIDYPSFVYRPIDWTLDLSLTNSSSMVSELAPVVLYLREVIESGDLLIVEEPESHLHPEMQVEFTRILAKAVRSGVRVLITTHSEWVLEELANLIRLSELPEERRDGIEGADVALEHSEVGAWFFNSGEEGKGSVVREIPLDIEEGAFPSGFGLITETLYNRWATISERIEEE